MKKLNELTPLTAPSAPNIDGLSKAAAKEKIESYLNTWEHVIVENQRRFSIALPRINCCAFLHGFLNPIKPNLQHHYSWCPAPYWYRELDKRGREL